MPSRVTPDEILNHPTYLYTTRQGFGEDRFVFSDGVFTSLKDALKHVRKGKRGKRAN